MISYLPGSRQTTAAQSAFAYRGAARAIGIWLVSIFMTACATVPRDDFKLRRDIAGLNLIKTPIEAAKVQLTGLRFVCEKDTAQYGGSPLRSVRCTRTIAGIGCKDDEHVTLEYGIESSLIERFATGRKNGCN